MTAILDATAPAVVAAFQEMTDREVRFSATRPPCPSAWCDGECATIGDLGDSILHCSTGVDTPTTAASAGVDNGAVQIRAMQYDALDQAAERLVEIYLAEAAGTFGESAEFTPAQARAFAAQLLLHASLLEPEFDVPAEDVRVGDWFPVDGEWLYVYSVDADAYADVVQIFTTVDREEFPEIGCGKDEEPHAFDFGETVRIRREVTPVTEYEIAITFDIDKVGGYTDEFLATLWHVAQANPAPFGDYRAGEIVSKLSFEIIRRWLATVTPSLYHHQPTHNYHKALTAIATYQPPADAGTGIPGVTDPHWHEGTWIPKSDATSPTRTAGHGEEQA